MAKASRIESFMLKLINNERAKAGLEPLAFDKDLNEAADLHSQWMLKTDTFSHTGKGSSSPEDRMAVAGYGDGDAFNWGENVAWRSTNTFDGLKDEVRAAHQSLMNSPGHRVNILSENFDEIGIGIKVGDYNGWDAVMITQNFGWDFA